MIGKTLTWGLLGLLPVGQRPKVWLTVKASSYAYCWMSQLKEILDIVSGENWNSMVAWHAEGPGSIRGIPCYRFLVMWKMIIRNLRNQSEGIRPGGAESSHPRIPCDRERTWNTRSNTQHSRTPRTRTRNLSKRTSPEDTSTSHPIQTAKQELQAFRIQAPQVRHLSRSSAKEHQTNTDREAKKCTTFHPLSIQHLSCGLWARVYGGELWTELWYKK